MEKAPRMSFGRRNMANNPSLVIQFHQKHPKLEKHPTLQIWQTQQTCIIYIRLPYFYPTCCIILPLRGVLFFLSDTTEMQTLTSNCHMFTQFFAMVDDSGPINSRWFIASLKVTRPRARALWSYRSRSMGGTPIYGLLSRETDGILFIDTLWLFNIAMENGPFIKFIDGLPFLKMGGSFHGELSNNQMVFIIYSDSVRVVN